MAIIQRIRICPVLEPLIYPRTTGEPHKVHCGLEDERALVVVEVKVLRVVAQQVARHVGHEHDRAEHVRAGGEHGVPEPLAVDLARSDWGAVYAHAHRYRNELFCRAQGQKSVSDGVA